MISYIVLLNTVIITHLPYYSINIDIITYYLDYYIINEYFYSSLNLRANYLFFVREYIIGNNSVIICKGDYMEKEKVILVHLNLSESESRVDNKLKELEDLVYASESEVVATVVQNATSINPSLYIGSGKAKEIKEMAENMEADAIVFNCELTGSQMKNLEEIIDKKIIDRTGLILDIFARRATTKEGKLQVKLAQLEYRLPRLVGYRNYLSREGAGIGTRGPGEQKLETDRRSVQREITQIKAAIKDSRDQRMIKSKRRRKSSLPVVSLIGYSNAGKSTILNALVDLYGDEEKKVYADDMLFATLDVSARMIRLENDREAIITDTVGFISDLPTKLVESFKSTLEEIEISDLLIIVVDSSNIDYKMQLEATTAVLKDMNLSQKHILYCYNKIDKNPTFNHLPNKEDFIYLNAKDEKDIKRLANTISDILFSGYKYFDINVGYDKIDEFMRFHLSVTDMEYTDLGLKGKIYIESDQADRYKEYINEV